MASDECLIRWLVGPQIQHKKTGRARRRAWKAGCLLLACLWLGHCGEQRQLQCQRRLMMAESKRRVSCRYGIMSVSCDGSQSATSAWWKRRKRRPVLGHLISGEKSKCAASGLRSQQEPTRTSVALSLRPPRRSCMGCLRRDRCINPTSPLCGSLSRTLTHPPASREP